jgi:Lon protease-like protein
MICLEMASTEEVTRIPIFPLPNVVHFPGTELKLHIFEPRYRQMVQDLMGESPESRFIGMVLIKPGNAGPGADPEIFPEGTAGLMLDVDPLPDGRSNILLYGDFRFRVEREVEGEEPYRQAEVKPLVEPLLNEADPAIQAVRRSILDLVESLADELGERFPIRTGALEALDEPLRFELLVNRIAAAMDLPPLSKMNLLNESLPDRALHLAGILRSRFELLDLLRPYRHLASDAELN